MGRDWRLNLSLSNININKDLLISSIRDQLASEYWMEQIRVFTVKWFSQLGENQSPQQDKIICNNTIDESNLMKAFIFVQNKLFQIMNENYEYEFEFEIECIYELIGMNLANLTGKDFESWETVYTSIRREYVICDSWCAHLPIETINSNVERLLVLPKFEHPFELVNPIGNLMNRSNWDYFMERHKDLRAQSLDIWEFIEKSLSMIEGFTFKPILNFQSNLIHRYDKKLWMQWVLQLPLINFQEYALTEVSDLDETELFLSILLNFEGLEKETLKEKVALLIWVIVDLWRKIDENLVNKSDKRTVFQASDETFRQKVEEEKINWQIELPKRIDDVFNLLYSSDEGLSVEITTSMLCHLNARNNRTKFVVLLRGKLLDFLFSNNLDLISFNVFLKKKSKNSLLSGARIACKQENRRNMVEEVWRAYSTFLSTETYYWYQPGMILDDEELLHAMGEALFLLKSPDVSIIEAFSIIELPTEGWGHQAGKYYSSFSNITHLYIVAIHATDFLREAKSPLALKIYDYIWGKFHNWLRHLNGYYTDEIDVVLQQLWSRLYKYYPSNYSVKVEMEIKRLNNLKQVLISIASLRANIAKEDGRLSESIKHQITQIYNQWISYTEQKERNKNLLEWMKKTFEEIK